MKRKVTKHGSATLSVSLPSKWAKSFNIKPGDEIEVIEKNNELNVIAGYKENRIKKATLNLDNFNTLMLNRYLDEFYRQGIEEIVLLFTKEKIPHHKEGTLVAIDQQIKKLAERFIGMEIVSETKNKIILESLISHEECEKIEIIQKRIFFLIKEFLNEFVKAMDSSFTEFYRKSYDYHDNIARFTYYYLRLLHFSDLPKEKKARLFGLYMIIDKTVDKVRHASERVNEMGKATPKIKKFVEEIFEFYLEQFDTIHYKNYTVSDFQGLVKKRYELVNKIKSSKFSYEELKVISELNILLEIINDFCEAYVAINIENYVSEA